jgi:hypothetical protein
MYSKNEKQKIAFTNENLLVHQFTLTGFSNFFKHLVISATLKIRHKKGHRLQFTALDTLLRTKYPMRFKS